MDAEEIATLEAVSRWVKGATVKWTAFKDTARHAKRIYNSRNATKVKYCMCQEGTSKQVCKVIVEWYESLD